MVLFDKVKVESRLKMDQLMVLFDNEVIHFDRFRFEEEFSVCLCLKQFYSHDNYISYSFSDKLWQY